MTRRPRAITLIGWIFIAVGAAGALKDVLEPRPHDSAELGAAWASRFLAVLGGAGLLEGFNWARWLLIAWMGFHIVLSALHSPAEMLVHIAFFAPMTYLLFRPRSVELDHHFDRDARRTELTEPGRGLRSVTPERWFLVGFVLLFVAYAVVLLTAPSTVGRGGR